jgi:hypothetical protein
MLLALALLLALLTACSPGAAPVSESLRDPSNPAAAEGAPAPGGSTTSASATSAAPPSEPSHAGHAGHQGH